MKASKLGWKSDARRTHHNSSKAMFTGRKSNPHPHYGKGVRAEATCETLNEAIDGAHDKIKLELEKVKDRKISLVRKAPRAIKN